VNLSDYCEGTIDVLLRSYEVTPDEEFVTTAQDVLGYAKSRLPVDYFQRLVGYLRSDWGP
jgi:hypothetical protein